MNRRVVARGLVWIGVLALVELMLLRAHTPALDAPHDTASMTFALVRLAALVAGAYLLFVSVLTTVGTVHRRAVAVLERVSSASLRAAMTAVIGAGSLAAVTAPPPLPARGSAGVAVIRDLTPPAPSTAVVRALPDTQVRPERPDTPQTPVWVVERGDSLWSIAEAHLRDVRGADVGDDEVATYWRLVVEANPLPNPDLLFAGQVVSLPPVPP